MKTLLTAINAKFIHTSPAVRCLAAAASEYDPQILEYTINTPKDFILDGIFARHPDVLGFSCYIWNIDLTEELIGVIRKILPHTHIIAGGPEAAFDPERLLNAGADVVMCGEGEEVLPQVLECYAAGTPVPSKIIAPTEVADLSALPFPYENELQTLAEGLQNRILYYETSRGCPFGCKYCLSAAAKGVRFLPLPRVFAELRKFLDANVRQVKLVDRTFNADKSRALAIWQYLIAHTNGITNFHFEISADLLDDDALALLATAPKGLFQFEIGVQSTDAQTLSQVNRRTNLAKLFANVLAIGAAGNIHQHLDLIAGLPGESFAAFERSFNEVYALRPQQLQLGFLKLLKGSALRAEAETLGIVAQDKAPYEVLYTRELTYAELRLLKGIEQMVETYYNSGQFAHSISHMIRRSGNSPFDFFKRLYQFYKTNGYAEVSHNKLNTFRILHEFSEQSATVRELLRFDLFANENAKNLPDWLRGEPCPKLSKFTKLCHVEKFSIDVLSDGLCAAPVYVLFDYAVTPVHYQYFEEVSP